MGLPVVASEQYPQGLGPTVGALAQQLGPVPAKLTFSCGGCPELTRWLDELATRRVHKLLLCGIEAHVCVQQSAMDLMTEGFDVYVAVDAVGSRHDIDYRFALQRMDSAGATLTTTEAALMEWCERAGTPEFKQISRPGAPGTAHREGERGMTATAPPLEPPVRVLMGPGPSDVHPRVLRAIAQPTVGHLDPYYLQIMNSLQQMLRQVLQTDNEMTFAVSATGSAGMEAAVVNLIEPGDSMLVGVNGVFGQRMADVASRAGRKSCRSRDRGAKCLRQTISSSTWPAPSPNWWASSWPRHPRAPGNR